MYKHHRCIEFVYFKSSSPSQSQYLNTHIAKLNKLFLNYEMAESLDIDIYVSGKEFGAQNTCKNIQE